MNQHPQWPQSTSSGVFSGLRASVPLLGASVGSPFYRPGSVRGSVDAAGSVSAAAASLIADLTQGNRAIVGQSSSRLWLWPMSAGVAGNGQRVFAIASGWQRQIRVAKVRGRR